MNMFISILYRIISDLYHFFLFFSILLVGFSMSYYCLYNGELEGHQWLGESFFTLFHSSLDATFEYREIGEVRSITGPVINMVFSIFFTVIMWNLLIATMSRSYGAFAMATKRAWAANHASLYIRLSRRVIMRHNNFTRMLHAYNNFLMLLPAFVAYSMWMAVMWLNRFRRILCCKRHHQYLLV